MEKIIERQRTLGGSLRIAERAYRESCFKTESNGELQVDLHGNLAGILNMSLEEKEKLSKDKSVGFNYFLLRKILKPTK